MSTNLREWRAANPPELGGALARLRQSRGLTQEELAARAGLRREYLSRMESGLATEQVKSLFAVLREEGYELVISPRQTSRG
jgi:HTH-type transcriptional regulator / antitoxin HipB